VATSAAAFDITPRRGVMPADVSRLSICAGDPQCRRYTPNRCEAAVIVPDVIHVLLRQHDQMRSLCTDVRASGIDKKGLFADLYQLVNVHERGDLAVVHPAARRNTANGDRTAVACMTEGENIVRALAELHALGVEHASFDSKFAIVHQAIHDHTAHEERDEFPLLRRNVSIQRLHMMAGELHDVEVMGVS
jgi:hypothetical protein